MKKSGRTTRLVDKYVQDFFNLKKCVPRDHFKSWNSHRIIFSKVVERLINEHGLEEDNLDIDFNRLILRNKK